MIYQDCVVTVSNDKSTLDKNIVLYRGDREVELRFVIKDSQFKYVSNNNLIEKTEASYGQLVIKTPKNSAIVSTVTETHEGSVVFMITEDMIDEIEEVGFYDFQIRLYDDTQTSRITIPPVVEGLLIKEPLDTAYEGGEVVPDEEGTEEESAFNEDGSYNKTEWTDKSRVTPSKMNKIEDAIYEINEVARNSSDIPTIGDGEEWHVLQSSDIEAGVDKAYLFKKVRVDYKQKDDEGEPYRSLEFTEDIVYIDCWMYHYDNGNELIELKNIEIHTINGWEYYLCEQIDGSFIGDTSHFIDSNYVDNYYARKESPIFSTSLTLGNRKETEEGYEIGKYSTALGYNVIASGKYSHAEGSSTTASGEYSYVSGYNSEASGKYSHAEGASCKATNEYSYAVGYKSKANAKYAHAEGNSVSATGQSSHAEGEYTGTNGVASHAEGSNAQANGYAAHAEGEMTTANGHAAHAEGWGSRTDNDCTHAEGFNTKASGYHQHVQGRLNIEDYDSRYAHIVGNGQESTEYNNFTETRSNAHTLDWNGNAWYQGDVFVGGSSQDDANKVATESYVNEALSNVSGGSGGECNITVIGGNEETHILTPEDITSILRGEEGEYHEILFSMKNVQMQCVDENGELHDALYFDDQIVSVVIWTNDNDEDGVAETVCFDICDTYGGLYYYYINENNQFVNDGGDSFAWQGDIDDIRENYAEKSYVDEALSNIDIPESIPVVGGNEETLVLAPIHIMDIWSDKHTTVLLKNVKIGNDIYENEVVLIYQTPTEYTWGEYLHVHTVNGEHITYRSNIDDDPEWRFDPASSKVTFATESYVDGKISVSLDDKFWTGTQAEYDALAEKNPNTIYLIEEE